MNETTLDRRLHPYRDDLAAESLRGRVEAANYVPGRPARVVAGAAPLRREPRFDAPLDTELLCGEAVRIYDVNEGWAWVQAEADSYVGYAPMEALGEDAPEPTHRVRALRTHLYPAPDIKIPPLALLSMNSVVAVESVEDRFAKLADGRYASATHLAPLGETEDDFVEVAQRFLGAPYLWGGRTSIGLDCSALVQLSLLAAGVPAPRDTDMQETALGAPLADPKDQDAFRRGDLVFWKGHVGIMLDEELLLHCNAHHMAAAIEPAVRAMERIAAAGSEVSSVRRLG